MLGRLFLKRIADAVASGHGKGPTPSDVSAPTLPIVVYETRPDPTEHMTEEERRYHTDNRFGR